MKWLDDKENRVILMLLVLVSLICGSLFWIIPNDIQSTALNKINMIVLTGTMLIIVWYTIETYKMRVVMKEQIDVSVLPAFAMSMVKTKDDTLELINIGNGVAINIEIDDLTINPDFEFKLKFLGPMCLAPNEKMSVEIKTLKAGLELGFSFAAHLDQRYANNKYFITIRFQDLLHRNYHQEICMGKIQTSIGKIIRD